jgi:hypothetical protein
MANSPNTIGIADSDAADKYLWTYQHTVGGTASQAQVYVPGPVPWPTYTVSATQMTLATASSHLLFVQADGTNYSRLKSVRIHISSLPAAASIAWIALSRVSTVGTGGTAQSFAAHDTSDTYGGTAQKLPSSPGSTAGTLKDWRIYIPTSVGTATPNVVEWEVPYGGKDIIFGTATTAGLALVNVTGIAAAMVDIQLEFTTTTFL